MSSDMERVVANRLRYFRDSLIGKNIKGIVHNMNSPLQVLSMHMELLAMDLNHLSSLKCDNMEMEAGISQALNRLGQLEEIVEKINHLVKLVGSRAYDEEHENDQGPVMVKQLVEETIEFWKSDLFFKHKVDVDLSTPGTSPVLIINEQYVRDGLDSVVFGLIELLRNAEEPALVIGIDPSDNRAVSLHFRPSGVRFPIERLESVSAIAYGGQWEKFGDSLFLEPTVMAMAVAKANMKRAGCEIHFNQDGVTLRLRSIS